MGEDVIVFVDLSKLPIRPEPLRWCSECGAKMTAEDLQPFRDRSGKLDPEDGSQLCQKCDSELYPNG